MRGYVRIFRESYNYDILCFITQYFVCERKRVAFNFEDEFNLCRKDEASLIRNNHSIFSVGRRPRCNNCVHRNTFSFFFIYISTGPPCICISKKFSVSYCTSFIYIIYFAVNHILIICERSVKLYIKYTI